MHGACYHGHLEVVRLLIERGADKGVAGNDGRTPLYSACYHGHLEVVRLLLEYGADTDATDENGDTPLYYACFEGRLGVIKLLLQRGATPIQGDDDAADFPDDSIALLCKWHALITPARRDAVLRLGWNYIDVPTTWTPRNHSQFPADFQQKVTAVALAWRLPLEALHTMPGDLVHQAAEVIHAQMGLHQ